MKVGAIVLHLARPALLAAVPAVAGAQGLPPDAPPGLPRLTGVVVGPGQRMAVFEGAGQPGAAPVAVGEGEQVGSYVVRLIRPGSVQVEADGRSYAIAPAPLGAGVRLAPADTGGVTFGLVVNPPAPAPD